MNFDHTLEQLVRMRHSTRVYDPTPIQADVLAKLNAAAAEMTAGPFGSSLRMDVLAAAGSDRAELRGLGTYGGIQNAMGFLAGAVQPGERDLEDYAYQMEKLVLLATDLGLGTCWLGGNFTPSSFGRRMHLTGHEVLPAVISLGLPTTPPVEITGSLVYDEPGARRLPWNGMFFDGDWQHPFTPASAGGYAFALEMVRLAPSAKNHQPWRLLRNGTGWHLFLQRTPGYREGFIMTILGVKDLQRLDMGIAMAHFDLAMAATGMSGAWKNQPEEARLAGDRMEYIATFTPAG